jgi:hypothetical protein
VSSGRERLRRTFNADAGLYERVRPGYPAALVRERKLADAGLGEGALFGPAEFTCRGAEVAYSADAYTDMLRTYSGVIAMDCAAREGLLRCLAGLIDSRYGGRITKSYLFGLRLARRLAGSR